MTPGLDADADEDARAPLDRAAGEPADPEDAATTSSTTATASAELTDRRLAEGEAVRAAWPQRSAGRDRKVKVATLLIIALVALVLRVFLVLVVHPACPGDDESWATGQAMQLDTFRDHALNPAPANSDCFSLGGDPLSTVAQAAMIADGRGMSSPAVFAMSGRDEPGAARPPSWTFVIAGIDKLGFRTPTQARLLACLLGAAAVVVIGHVAWSLAGRKAGTAAAVIAALYANLFINDFHMLSDGPYALVTATVIWCAYRLWVKPTLGRAVAVGAMVALAYYTRSEAVQMLIWMVIPLAFFLRDLPLRRRVAIGGTAVLAGLLLVAPYWFWNTQRFHQGGMTLGTGTLLLNSSCDDTYYGKHMGSLGFACFDQRTRASLITVTFENGTDESDADADFGRIARAYVKANARRVPFVAMVRVARIYEIYQPAENMRVDVSVERRGNWEPWLGLYQYYLLVPFTIAGLVHLRRRRIPLSPMLGMFAVVTFAAAGSFGLTRYRITGEVVLCIVGGIGVSALLSWYRDTRAARAKDPEAPTYIQSATVAATTMLHGLRDRAMATDRRLKIAAVVAAVLFLLVMLVSWTATPDPSFAQTQQISSQDATAIANGVTSPPASYPECQVLVRNRPLFTDFTQHASVGKLQKPGQVYTAFDRLVTVAQDPTFKADATTLRGVVGIAANQDLSIVDASQAGGPEARQAFLDALRRTLLFVSQHCPEMK